MRRRDVIATIAGTASVWPTSASAQPPARIRCLGVMTQVRDGGRATLALVGTVMGRWTRCLGVELCRQTGTIQDLYRNDGIDPRDTMATVTVRLGRPICHERVLG